MVKNNGVRAFALEGDYGGCEQVNRYIHGGEGTAQEAAAAIGFSIYRTEEMAELISYMRQYNESALEGEDLRFYGFDMQRLSYSMRFLKESCKELEVDTTNLQKLVEGENWSSECDLSTRTETLTQVKKELESKNGSENAIHFVDILMQHSELQTLTNDDGATLRDQFMAENVQWILQQEQRKRQNWRDLIFVGWILLKSRKILNWVGRLLNTPIWEHLEKATQSLCDFFLQVIECFNLLRSFMIV